MTLHTRTGKIFVVPRVFNDRRETITPEQATTQRQAGRVRFRKDLGPAIVAAVFLAFFIRFFVAEMVLVPSHSMEPTLVPGDYVLTSKLAYSIGLPKFLPFSEYRLPDWNWSFREIEKNHVVVFTLPNDADPGADPTSLFVKRVIALPGEFVSSRDIRFSFPELQSERGLQVPFKGLVLPLHPGMSQQAQRLVRNEGVNLTLTGDKITVDGKEAEFYVLRENYYWVLGDNRHHSFDSRYWGFLPESLIAGRPVMVYWSMDSKTEARTIRWDRIGRFIN